MKIGQQMSWIKEDFLKRKKKNEEEEKGSVRITFNTFKEYWGFFVAFFPLFLQGHYVHP